jgi:hypothetical protein
MTRPQVVGKPETPIFPDEAKANARTPALLDDVKIIENKQTVEGGDVENTWAEKETVKGRIDAAGGSGRGLTGAVLNEEATHVITMVPTANVEATDKLEVNGIQYDIVALRRFTKAASVMAEVRA